MQLSRRFALCAFVVASATTALVARADEEAPSRVSNVNARATTDVAAYTDSNGVSVLTPSASVSLENPTAGLGASGRYLVDMVSAASPDIVATASPRWSEIRNAGNLGASYKPGRFGVAAGGAASYTPDYLALSGNAQLTQDFDDKNLTLVEGYGYGHDTIGRNGTPFSVFSRTLETHSLTLGASRVVNRGLVIGLFVDAMFERGDQSKPYRYIPVFSAAEAANVPRGASLEYVGQHRAQPRPLEQLPLERDRFALIGRLAWRAGGRTLRFEERLYHDSWNLHASTTDIRYFIDLSDRVTVWPHGRFHIQNSVDFWQRAYVSRDVHDLPLLRTGDRELSSLYNLGLGGGLRLALGRRGALDDWALSFTADSTFTGFADALYVKSRFAAIVASSLEVAF